MSTPPGWKMLAQGNPHITGQVADGPKSTLYRYSEKGAPKYSNNMKVNEKRKRNNTYRGKKFLIWNRRTK